MLPKKKKKKRKEKKRKRQTSNTNERANFSPLIQRSSMIRGGSQQSEFDEHELRPKQG